MSSQPGTARRQAFIPWLTQGPYSWPDVCELPKHPPRYTTLHHMAKNMVNLPGLLVVKPCYDVDPDTGDQYENVLFFQSVTTATAPSLANLQSMASHFDSPWGAVFQAYGAQTKHYIGSIWTDWSSPFGLSYDGRNSITPIAGTQGATVPPNTSVLVGYSNGERYRGGHFRTYLPWVGTGSITGTAMDQVVPAVVTNIVNAINGVQTAMNTSGVLGGQNWKLYRHRYLAGTARLDPIVTYNVRTRLATQRRRLRKAPHH